MTWLDILLSCSSTSYHLVTMKENTSAAKKEHQRHGKEMLRDTSESKSMLKYRP